MKKRTIKLVIQILFFLGMFFLSIPIFKNSLIIMKVKNNTVEMMHTSKNNKIERKEVPKNRIENNETIIYPSIEEFLKLPSQTIKTSIGFLSIPSGKIYTPVFEGLNNNEMLLGVGNMFPDRKPQKNNIVIVGHHLGVSDLLLGNLKNVKKNEKILYHYFDEVYEYQIAEKKIVKETDLSVLNYNTDPTLTLITCDKPEVTDMRLVVTAKLIKQNSEKKKEISLIENETNIKNIWRKNIIIHTILPFSFMFIILFYGSYILWRYT